MRVPALPGVTMNIPEGVVNNRWPFPFRTPISTLKTL
jgi:hypothetical protein